MRLAIEPDTPEVESGKFGPRLDIVVGAGRSAGAYGELIGDGTDGRRAIYHQRRLVSDPNVSDKEARAAANCIVVHRECHDDPVSFYNLHGFYPDDLIRK